MNARIVWHMMPGGSELSSRTTQRSLNWEQAYSGYSAEKNA